MTYESKTQLNDHQFPDEPNDYDDLDLGIMLTKHSEGNDVADFEELLEPSRSNSSFASLNNIVPIYKNKLSQQKADQEFAYAAKMTSLMLTEQHINRLNNRAEFIHTDGEEDDNKLTSMESMPVTILDLSNKNKDDINDVKFPIYITTWEDTKTGQLLGYSIGFGGMGTNVNDVSHLNITRDEFMAQAMPIITSGGSQSAILDSLEKAFPAQKNYSSFSDYQQSLTDLQNNPNMGENNAKMGF